MCDEDVSFDDASLIVSCWENSEITGDVPWHSSESNLKKYTSAIN